MLRYSFYLIFLFLVVSCHKNQVTGKRGINLISESELDKYSAQEYKKILDSSIVLADDDPSVIRVRTIGNNIKSAVERFYASKGSSNALEGYNWQFNVVKDDSIFNAFCMPGGKVIVYTRLIKEMEDDSMFAFVMSHEISHAIARHGNKRMSQGMLVNFGEKTLAVALIAAPHVVKKIALASFGAQAQIGMLQFSRNDEKEADKMGLTFMALAGYNPNSSVKLWKKMVTMNHNKSLVFLQTHPTDEKRLKLLKKNLPKAQTLFKKP
jgi:predicted Zn-dependent protease